MPHIPRSMPPADLGILGSVPKAPRTSKKKSTVPYNGPSTPKKMPDSSSAKRTKLVQKLSMRDWDVDPLRIINQVTQEENKADEHSGLVSYPGNAS